MMLTNDEIYAMYNEPRSDAEMLAFGREVEAAVIAKLCEGVEWLAPFDGLYEEGHLHNVWTAEQVQTMIAAAVAKRDAQWRERIGEPVAYMTQFDIPLNVGTGALLRFEKSIPKPTLEPREGSTPLYAIKGEQT